MVNITFTVAAGMTGSTILGLTGSDIVDFNYVPLLFGTENGSVSVTGSAQSTITFDSQGGTPIDPITQDEGTQVTRPADPTKDGFTFEGWVPDVPATMPVDDVTCIAQWTANQSTITFDSQGGTPIAPITQDEGTPVTPPADPTRAGFTFQGWSPAVPANMPVDDLTCVAQWDALPGTIIFSVNDANGTPGNNVISSISITPNSNLGSGTLLLTYDITKLTYVTKTFGPAMGELNGFNPNYANNGNIRTIYYAPVYSSGLTA